MHNTGFAFHLLGVTVCNKNTQDIAGVLALQDLATVWGTSFRLEEEKSD